MRRHGHKPVRCGIGKQTMNTTMLKVIKNNGDVVARVYIASSDHAIESEIEAAIAYELIHRYGSGTAMAPGCRVSVLNVEIDEVSESIAHMATKFPTVAHSIVGRSFEIVHGCKAIGYTKG